MRRGGWLNFTRCIDKEMRGTMDIKEKEELIRLLSKYQEETMEKVKKWGSLASCPFIEKMNTIAKVGCYLSLEIAKSMKR